MDNSLNDMSFEHANNLDYSEFHNVFNMMYPKNGTGS